MGHLVNKWLFSAFMLSISTQVLGTGQYLGRVYSATPEGCRYDGGSGGVEIGSLGYALVECNGRRMLWLEELIGHDGNRSVSRIVDVANMPSLKRGQGILDIECHHDDKAVGPVIAVGTWVRRKGGGYATGISHAWTFDFSKRKIKSINPKRVKCEMSYEI